MFRGSTSEADKQKIKAQIKKPSTQIKWNFNNEKTMNKQN